MNCLQFRRHKLALPKELGQEHLSHLESCFGCAEFATRTDELEAKIEAAVQLPVPEGLADRVILSHKLRSRRRFGVFAVAASLVLALSLSAVHSYLASEDDVEEALIAHVMHEPESLQAAEEVPEYRLAAALAQAGGELRGPIGEAVYYKLCPVPGGSGVHIVLVTPFGRTTLLLLPEKGEARAILTKHGMSATVLPLGRGSVGVIADSPADVERMGQLLRNQVAWQT